MATKRFYIIDNELGESDGIIQTSDKSNVGIAYNKEAPTGMFIDCYLEDRWIITDEEYKLLKEAKKENKICQKNKREITI